MRHRVCCDLCGTLEPAFIVTSKYVRDAMETVPFKFNPHNKHVTKHLCIKCFVKIFPEEVV